MGNDNSSLEWVGRGEKERAASRLIALEQEVERLQVELDATRSSVARHKQLQHKYHRHRAETRTKVEQLQARNDDLSALLSVQDKNHLACIEQHEAAEAEVGRLQRDDAAKLAAANRLLAQRDYHRETLRQIHAMRVHPSRFSFPLGDMLNEREPWLFTDTPPEQKPKAP